MKRKIAAIMLMALALPLFSPSMPKAQAALVDDQLVQAAAGNATATQIQELLKIQDKLASGNKEALVGTIAQTALARTGNADLVNNLATVAGQLSGQNQTVSQEDIARVMETAVRGKVEAKIQEEVGSRLSGYQQQFALLSALLNNNNLTPKVLAENNSFSTVPQTTNINDLLNMTATAYASGLLGKVK